jgi:lipoprotein-anchoring transpeptidase ErfK/SrfK
MGASFSCSGRDARGVSKTGLRALVLLGSALAAAQPALAQNRVFNHQTNRWEIFVPGETADGGAVAVPGAADPASPLPADLERTEVAIRTPERPGTVIIDTERRRLYLVEPGGFATRYPVGVGREGFGFSGAVSVGRKAEWPDWIPPAEMREREAARGRMLPVRLAGGEDNPLGARALYLFRGNRDTLFRIHGTNEPWTVGTRTSSGCIRMRNEDVIELYGRVPEGARVVVIGPDGAGRGAVYAERS